MALTFPLALDAFFDGLPIQTGVADLGEAMEISENGYGEIMSAAVGNRLWSLDIEIATRNYQEGAAIMARLNTLRYPGRSLLARAAPTPGPFADPLGAALGGAQPVLISVASNNRDVTLGGMPQGYVLTTGDFFSFTYGTNPTRYALHQLVSGGVANAQGRMTVEVVPFMALGFAANAPVRLIKPLFKAIVVPGKTNPGKIGGTRRDGISFSLMQTFR